MSEKTFIKGKDCDLESSIDSMQTKLQNLGVEIDVSAPLNPLPYVYSVHIKDKNCNLMFTNGKGASQKSTLASAYGEYFERLSCNYFFADYYLGEKFANDEFVHYPNEKWFTFEEEMLASEVNGLLDKQLWNYFDPEHELLASDVFDMNSGAGERGICALPFECQSDKETVYFPVNIIGNIFVSNGMAAGNTKNEARVQALSEIFERYAKNKIIAEGISLPQIPQEVLNRYPHIQESITALEGHGYHLRICDASLGGVYPVISVTLINPKDGSVLASFGAHPSFEVALERTVTELLQGRTLDMLDDFFVPSFNSDEVASHENLEAHFINSTGLISYEFFKNSSDFEFVDWDYDATTQNEFGYLSDIAHKAGFEIYITDYNHLGVYACRMLIPGMSDIYPVSDLSWSNNNEGAYFREAILSLQNLDYDDIEALLENFEASEHSDLLRVCEFIGVSPDANTAWASLQLGELKAMLNLALQDYSAAKEWVVWILHMSQLDAQRTLLYRCLHAMLEITLSGKEFLEYKESLVFMYSDEIVHLSEDILDANETFYGLHSAGLSLEGFVKHQTLLDGYAKVHKAKAMAFK
jgi:ribosomal protein S12 methylthiotransferase accessory factor